MKKLFILILFVAASFAVHAQTQGLSEEGYKHWLKAIVRMEDLKQESDYALVINDFLEVLKTDPNYADTYFNLGKIYTKMGELKNELSYFEKAKECYDKYLALKPSDKNAVLKDLTRLEIKIDELKKEKAQQELQREQQRQQEARQRQEQEQQRQEQLQRERLLTAKGSTIFNGNGVKLKKDKVRQVMITNTNALQMYNKGFSKNGAGDALITLGCATLASGFIMIMIDAGEEVKTIYSYYDAYGYRTSSNVTSSSQGLVAPAWALMGAGVAMLIPGITLKVQGKKQIRNSVDVHNNIQKTASAELKCNFTGNGLSFKFNF